MKRRILLLTILGIIIIGSIGAIIYMLQPKTLDRNTKKFQEANVEVTGISMEEVASHTGRDGNSCWVVVDDTVYQISGFALWADGVHSPSGGKARCGKDLSEVINESPHGKSKLKYLKEVGTFKR